jgi:hypothetical protein
VTGGAGMMPSSAPIPPGSRDRYEETKRQIVIEVPLDDDFKRWATVVLSVSAKEGGTGTAVDDIFERALRHLREAFS